MRRKILTIIAVPFLAAAALTGCSSASNTGAGDTDAAAEGDKQVTIEDLVGSWNLADIAEGGAAVEFDVPVGLTVDEDGAYHLDATCNALNGTFTVEDGKVSSGPLMSTRMACPEDAAAVEAILADTFSDLDAAHFSDSDDLVFEGEGKTLVFDRD